MASELKNALAQVKTDVDTVTTTNRVQLGLVLTALPETSEANCVVSVTMRSGQPNNDTFTATSEKHQILMRAYWLLIAANVEIVEQNMAIFWDALMTKFFGADGDRNLSEKATIALVGGIEGNQPYECGYETIGGKLHRVMIIPLELILDTHSV